MFNKDNYKNVDFMLLCDRLLKKTGMRRYQLAEYVGIPRTTLNEIQSNGQNPSYSYGERLVLAYQEHDKRPIPRKR